MKSARLSQEAGRVFQSEALQPGLTRALRGTVAFVAPLVVAQVGGLTHDVSFVAVGAQIVALTDVRGAYRFRVAVLVAVMTIIALTTLAGSWVAGHAVASVLAMGAIAMLSGAWRHLSTDYGTGLGIASALLFVMALAAPPGEAPWWQHGAFTLLGGLWGLALQAMIWPFRRQHGLRHATAESWVAVSTLFAAMRPDVSRDESARAQAVAQAELDLRAALDRTADTLAAASTHRTAALVAHLGELQMAAARLSTRCVALNVALEGLVARPDFARLGPTLDSVLMALTNMARAVALTTITHRPENFAAAEVRLRRCSHLMAVLAGHLRAPGEADADRAQAAEILRQIDVQLAAITTALRQTVDHAAGSVGLPPLRLPELSVLSLKTLSAWVNPAPQLDPVLFRHAVRVALLTMAGIALYTGLDIPRGYWIAFTVVVVLQPDYGATLKRAGQRVAGTLAGGVLASALLWLKMPLPVLDLLVAATVFGFAYFQRHRYGLAVFFVTLMLVFLTETTSEVHLDFTLARLGSNLLGASLAIAGALLFWPSWERQRLPALLAAALRANRVYLDATAVLLREGRAFGGDAVTAKRRAETASSLASASLQRMLGEPAGRQVAPQRSTALTHYNMRVTRAVTLLALQARTAEPLADPGLARTIETIAGALESFARLVETDEPLRDAIDTALARAAHEKFSANAAATARERLVLAHLAKISTELRAMLLALDADLAPPVDAAPSPAAA